MSQPQEPCEDDLSNSNLSQESEQDNEAANDLDACSEIAYYQNGETHGVKHV